MSDGHQQSLFPDGDPEQASAPVAHARRTDRATSHEAALSVTPQLTEYQKMVLRVIDHYYGLGQPFTDKVLVADYHRAWENRIGLDLMLQSESGIRTRRNELVAQGYVEDTGRTIRMGKRNHTLWRLVQI